MMLPDWFVLLILLLLAMPGIVAFRRERVRR